ncbi:MAG TPA: toll/interleukin-1 receptor domain-containing protein [Terriglobales bacterium]
MNHGRLGYIDGNKLRLAPTILEQFGLRKGNVLFGVYYPRDSKRADHQKATVDDDFMLTPLFPRLWDRAGCFIIRIKHEAKAFAKVAGFLAKERVSIYCSEFSRSGYRYGTWNIHAVANRLPKRLTYDRCCSGYTEAINFLEAVKQKMVKECADVLFVDPREPDLEQPVKLLHLSALSYFAHYYGHSRKSRPPFVPFRLRVGQDGHLIDEQGEFAEVIKRIRSATSRDLRHSVFFVEADRRNFNMRLALFSGDKKNSIFVAKARYNSSGDWNEFRGLLARISEHLPKSCNIWKCSTEKLEVSEDHESGIIKMVVEDVDTHISLQGKIRRIEESLVKLSNNFAHRTKVEKPRVQLASVDYCTRRIDADYVPESEKHSQVFISYHKPQRAKAELLRSMLQARGLNAWLDDKDLTRGEWAQQIKNALARAKEFVLLWSPACRHSEWVMTEWITAALRRIPITIFLVSGRARDLPEQLRDKQAVRFSNARRRNAALARIAEEINQAALTSVD